MLRPLADMDPSRLMRTLMSLAMAGTLGLGLAGVAPALADDDDDDESAAPMTGLEAYYQRLEHEPAYASGHEEAVAKLVQNRDIAIPYDYIATLMRIPNAFGEGAACVVCHASNDPERSYRGLDLTTCEGIKTGPTEPPARAVFEPGHAEGSRLRRYLRNNRMPYGVSFDAPRDIESIQTIKTWIDEGAHGRVNRW